jgi:Rieske Fe-S protein
VRLPDGQLLVLSGKDLTGGCTVTWDERGQVFRNPCHGATYNIRGEVVAGPATQGLGRFADWTGDRLLVADMTRAPVPVETR